MTTRTMGRLVVAAMFLGGCGSSGGAEPEGEHAHHGGGEHHGEGHHEGGEHAHSDAPPEPSRVLEDGTRLFGAELDAERAPIALSEVLAAPRQFEGQVIKTEGEIASVCQSMGCWMEIRTDADSPGIRVPMANHAFFLPRDVAGHRATIEGTVVVAALSEEDRAHLESEGATATDRDVSIEATGVLIHP